MPKRKESDGQGPDETAGTRVERLWSSIKHPLTPMPYKYLSPLELRHSGSGRRQHT